MIYGSEKYRKDDMPIAASFVSEYKRLIVWLEPREEKPGPNGTTTIVQQSGLKIQFEDGELSVKNSKVLEKMLESKKFNATVHGWRVNPEDPTGFWMAHGLIKTKEILVVEDEFIPIDADPEKRFGKLDPFFKKLPKPENVRVIRKVRF